MSRFEEKEMIGMEGLNLEKNTYQNIFAQELRFPNQNKNKVRGLSRRF